MAKRSSPAAARAKTSRRSRSTLAQPALPTVLAEKVLENRSRTIFNEAVLPWLVTDWTEHDYGIDAIIEITRAREVGENFDATGKRFAIQLKATEEEIAGRNAAPVRVKPEQIRYWIESTEPVLLVLCHVPTRQLFWRWIDYPVVDELNRRDPAWIGQETVTVHLPTTRTFDAAARKEIATFVTTFRRSARRVLAPGAYLALHTRLLALASTLTAHARDAGFQSVLKRLADLEASIRTSTYVVVLTGPARAGKSTLLNALVGREVSPVGRLPTTAVSLMVMAGPRDEAEVVLAGDERVRGDATAAFLEEYATQEKNPDNHKGVRMVAVRLVNELLERGVAYADAPGLHDPSEEIRAVTEAALKAAHAVMYVLDVSPAKDGGFYLSNHHLADLKRLAAMAERLFVVLNKADALDADERSFVAHYVEQTLRKYSAWDSLPVPPLFLSASAGWKWQTSGRLGESPLAALDDAIWTHLLRTNSTGLDRLGNAVVELRRAGSDFASLLQTRRMSGTEAFRLRGALDECRRTQRELIARCRQRTENDERFVSDRLTEQTAALLQRLKARLEAVPLDGTLPNAAQLEQELQAQVTNILGQVWLETSARFQVFASSVSQEVERSLQQARLATGASEQVSFLLPQVPALNIAADSFEEAWTGLFTGGLFGLLIGGPWGWALLAGGWLAGLFLGREPKRKREIARIVDRVLSSLTAALEVVLKQVHEKIRIYLGSLERHVNDRISVFVHDVEGQLKKLDIPIGPDEARRLEVHEQAVRATLNSLHNACTQLELQGRTEQAAPMAAPSEKTF